MNTGYIKLYRKVTNSFVWTNANMFKLWSLCLMKASHKESRFIFNGQEIAVSSGQFVTGRAVIEKEFNEGVPRDQQIVGRTLWRWLKKFENEQMLSISSTPKYSVITINNWDDYQVNDQQVSNNRPTSVQQLSTYKNEKNDKNEKNINNNNKGSSIRSICGFGFRCRLKLLFEEELFKQICQNQEIKKPNLQSWADDIRKMIEIDKRTENQVRGMIEWSQHNVFWASNILSAKKLREKYDTMAAQANRDYKTKQTKTLEYEKFSTDELPI
ncbi:replication protein [Enterococcus faecium]|uniref:replication protein n=1 Tax=Enterococcus faecium TaxID=1352 RepID=UPI0021AD63DE|nr:replication protein [Enterococcus faecium]UWS52291.1 replication protein [Enterococcus faecium]